MGRFGRRTGCVCQLHGAGGVLEDAPISIETEQNRHPRRRLPKKQKKNHDRRRGVLDV